MADVTTADLLQTLQGDGLHNNAWGDIANANLQRLEDKLVKRTALAVTGGTVTLTSTQELVMLLDISGVLVSGSIVEFSGRKGFWIVKNGTSAAFSLTVRVTGQTGITVAQGTVAIIYCDGTDIRSASAALTTLTADLMAAGFNILFSNATGLKDDSSNFIVELLKTASAVNFLTAKNNATGSNPVLAATGSDTDVGLDLGVKGAGLVRAQASVVPVSDGVPSLGAAAARWLKLFLATGGIIDFNNGDVTITHSADKLTFAGAASGYAFDVAPDVGGSHVALLATEGQTVAGGAKVTSKSLGVISSGTVTVDVGARPKQDLTNGGAFVLSPGSNNGSTVLEIVNNGSAGAITKTGWDKADGDAFDTTNGHKFKCFIDIGPAGKYLGVKAMQ